MLTFKNIIYVFISLIIMVSYEKKEAKKINTENKIVDFELADVKLPISAVLEKENYFCNPDGGVEVGVNVCNSFKYFNNEITVSKNGFRKTKDTLELVDAFLRGLKLSVNIGKEYEKIIDEVDLDIQNNRYYILTLLKYKKNGKTISSHSLEMVKFFDDYKIMVSIYSHMSHKFEPNILDKDVIENIYKSLDCKGG